MNKQMNIFQKVFDMCTAFIFFDALATYLFLTHMIFEIFFYTSSTAQGGGGSFKNRKRIGEIDCCEWRMSEQKHWPTD